MSGFGKEQVEFMRRACLLCDRSSLEVRTGCVLVVGSGVVAEGWNTTEKVHAEQMAVFVAKKAGKSLQGATVYITRFSCMDCARELAKQGIAELFYMSDHFSSGNEALPIFKSFGVAVCQIPQEVVWK